MTTLTANAIRINDRLLLKKEWAQRLETTQECRVIALMPGADCSLDTVHTGKLQYKESIFKVVLSNGHHMWLPIEAFESIIEAEL